MTTTEMNTQYAPWPDALAAAVAEFQYKEGWRFYLNTIDRDFEDEERKIAIAGGLTLQILVPCQDSYHPELYRPVMHYHPVPAATYNRQSWERWIIDRVMETETHEAAEWARFVVPNVEAERRPFAATHGPGDNPYVLHEYATEEQRQTSYLGVRNDL